MADKPSRALVIYGDGIMPALGQSHSHLHALASRGVCGFLALRDLPPQVSKDERVVRELAQLLDVHDFCNKGELVQNSVDGHGDASGDCKEHTLSSSIAERFKGMKAAMVTNSNIASAFGKRGGFAVTALHELCNKTGISQESEEPPNPCSAASELLSMLGLQEEMVAESNKFDLVFLHIGPFMKKRENENGDDNANLASSLEWINALVGRIMEIIKPGSVVASRLYLALVLSYGSISNTDDSSLLISSEEISPNLESLLPPQSYTMKGGESVDDVRHHHPMLVVQHQEAVTRRDGANIFSFEEFQEVLGDQLVFLQASLKVEKSWKKRKRRKEVIEQYLQIVSCMRLHLSCGNLLNMEHDNDYRQRENSLLFLGVIAPISF